MVKEILFREVNVVVVGTCKKDKEWIKEHKDEYKHCYGLRHPENDWSEPVIVENYICIANRWGFFFSNKELNFPDGKTPIQLTEDERELLRDLI